MLYPIISVILVSLISLIGVFLLSIKKDTLNKSIFVLVSLAVGALLGDAFIHIIPEAFSESTNMVLTSALIIFGILIFLIIEKFLHWHHHGQDEDMDHVHPVGKLVLVSDGIHNLIDGIIIGASFMVSVPVGVATTVAVIMHEIPQEIGDFAVLIHSGFSKKRATWLNFASALLAVLGVFIVFAFGDSSENFINWVLPISAGGFIYIAMSDLIPELNKIKRPKDSFVQIVSILIGVSLMAVLLLVE